VRVSVSGRGPWKDGAVPGSAIPPVKIGTELTAVYSTTFKRSASLVRLTGPVARPVVVRSVRFSGKCPGAGLSKRLVGIRLITPTFEEKRPRPISYRNRADNHSTSDGKPRRSIAARKEKLALYVERRPTVTPAAGRGNQLIWDRS